MSKRNREKRAAKKRNRQRRGAPPPRPEFGGGPHGPDCMCGLGGDGVIPPGPEELADLVLDAARAHSGGDPDAAGDCAAELTSGRFAPPQRTVCSAAAIALATAIGHVWRSGWLPVDVWEMAQRNTDGAAASLLLDTIAADVARHAPAAVHERWVAQVDRLDATMWWEHDRPHLEQWSRRHGLPLERALVAAITLLAELITLPTLPRIVPPPGEARRATTSTAHVDQKVLARVRGLLAKAESTQFPEEAEALSAKAQELMNRHAFERALLDADTHKKQAATSSRLWLDSPYLDAKSHLVAAIARANRCRSVFYSELGFVALVGETMDLEITELLATSLLVQATRAMVAEGSHTTHLGTSRTRSFRRAFLISYAVRVGERLDAAGARAHEPVEDARLLPVLAARSRVVEETFEAMFPDTYQRKPASISNGAGWHAGRAAADRADLDIERRAVGA